LYYLFDFGLGCGFSFLVVVGLAGGCDAWVSFVAVAWSFFFFFSFFFFLFFFVIFSFCFSSFFFLFFFPLCLLFFPFQGISDFLFSFFFENFHDKERTRKEKRKQ